MSLSLVFIRVYWYRESLSGLLSTSLYRDTNRKIERITKYITNAVITSNSIFVPLPLVYTIVNYYFLDSGKDSFYLISSAWFVHLPKQSYLPESKLWIFFHVHVCVRKRWPFDWKTPSGYLVAWLAQFAGSISITITAIAFFNIVLGSCWLFIVFSKDITNDVAAFNVKISKADDQAKLMEQFCNLIQIYSDAKRWATILTCEHAPQTYFYFLSGWWTNLTKYGNIQCWHSFHGICWLYPVCWSCYNFN